MRLAGSRAVLPAFLVALALAGAAPGRAQGPVFDTDLDPATGTGKVLYTPPGGKARELASREGWAAEQVDAVVLGARRGALVLWASHPRRQYLSPELYLVEPSGAARKVWPEYGRTLHWANPRRTRLQPVEDGVRLLVEHALVGENFAVPRLVKREVWHLTAKGGTRISAGVGEARTPDQVLNLVADHIAEGRVAEARKLGATLPADPPGLQDRLAVLLAPHARDEAERALARQALMRAVDRHDEAAPAAADQLLKLSFEE